MEIQEALTIVHSLARGVNPTNGALFEVDSPYNHPNIIRALYRMLEALPKRKKTPEERQEENNARGLPRNTGLPWTEERRKAVADGYRLGASIDALAESEERTRTAIIAELRRQEVITLEEAEKLGLATRPRRTFDEALPRA